MAALTMMCPCLQSSRPASRASLFSGVMPTDMMTISQTRVFSWLVVMRSCSDCPDMDFTPSPRTRDTPGLQMGMDKGCHLIIERCHDLALHLDDGGFNPSFYQFSAISMPMNPPPTTTALLGFSVSTKPLIRSESGMERRLKTLSRSMPLRCGFMGSAPGDRMILS